MIREEILKQMKEGNPEVSELIHDLDLRNPRTGLPYGAPTDDRSRKLREIACRVLRRGRVYTREQALSLLGDSLRISRQRAVNGLEMMMKSGVLKPHSGTGISLNV